MPWSMQNKLRMSRIVLQYHLNTDASSPNLYPRICRSAAFECTSIDLSSIQLVLFPSSLLIVYKSERWSNRSSSITATHAPETSQLHVHATSTKHAQTVKSLFIKTALLVLSQLSSSPHPWKKLWYSSTDPRRSVLFQTDEAATAAPLVIVVLPTRIWFSVINMLFLVIVLHLAARVLQKGIRACRSTKTIHPTQQDQTTCHQSWRLYHFLRYSSNNSHHPSVKQHE